MRILAPLLFLLALSTCATKAAKILSVIAMPGSHFILGSALVNALGARGHDLTVISPVPLKDPPKNGTYRNIVVDDFVKEMDELRKTMNIFERTEKNFMLHTAFLSNAMLRSTEMILKHPGVQELLRSGEKFDVVIAEEFFDDAFKAFGSHFDAPFISFSTVGANGLVSHLVGNPTPPSYIPDLRLSYSSHMTFLQRVVNSIAAIFFRLFEQIYVYPAQNRLIQKYIPNPPHLKDVLYNVSLVLLNSHPSINQPIPKVPAMVEIGGFHVQPSKKLPQDLQDYLDGAKDGVIYFSLGSQIRGSTLPAEKRDAIVRAFSKLKQKVLWKWEDDELPGKPDNVRIGKWLPQQEILAHPNVKIFITHGGMLSTTETVYHGVPILAIPILGDQRANARVVADNGFGLILPYKELSEEALSANLRELLDNPRYTNNAKLRSALFHDRQVKPMDTAIYWVEYVIRHRGSPHLRVAALDLPWYKYLLLDVAAFLMVASLLVLYLNYLVVKTILCKLRNRKGGKVKKN